MPAIAATPAPVRTPGWVRIAIPPDGCELALLLARMPQQHDDARSLVIGGVLSLTCEIACERFVRRGTLTLRDDRRTYASAQYGGRSARVTMEAALPPAQALDLSTLRVEDMPLPRPQHVRCVVPHADGSLTEVPRVLSPAASRNVPANTLVAAGTHAVSLQYAMHPGSIVRPSAAVLAINAGNLYAVPLGDGAVQTPQQHLPLIGDASASQWPDAMDATTIWYAPQFALVFPAANADPSNAPFCFAYSSTGIVLGSGGTATGLHATVRFTLQVAADNHVPLNNLSIALEIPYRQTGSAAVLAQRLPGTITQSGNSIAVEIELIDDWVRLAYASLAYGAQNGMPGPRLVVDYAFTGYQWIDVPASEPGTFHILAAGKLQALQMAASREQLSPGVENPTIVARDLAVLGPTSYVQYRREGPPSREIKRINNAAIAAAAAPLTQIRIPPRRALVTRCVVREDAVDVATPCNAFGAFYRELAADGVTSTAVGCQDALKLGETSLKAFDEITALRDPAYRVYRSLQQPGRFLVIPSAYRVGRYSQSAGDDKAYRPTILLYGQLGGDPNQDRYCMTATLIADVSPYQLALLQSSLAAYAPANMAPTIVLPTDPFVNAAVAYTWAVPSALDQPQAVTVVDAIVVTLSMALSDAQLLTTMLDRSGIQGSVTYTLADGTAFNSALNIDGSPIGPPDTGPVTAQLANGTFTFTNRTAQTVNVFDAAVYDTAGAVSVVPVNVTLAAGATTTLGAPANAARALVDARMSGSTGIAELDVFVEDVTITVTFIDQVAFANHQLTALQVLSRLTGTDHVVTTDLAENGVAAATFTLPVTSYLTQRSLDYALAETTAAGPKTTAWRTWDLTKGTVIGITADLL